MNGYTLTKEWFSFYKENLDKTNNDHTAMYIYIVELFNQNNWVNVLGLPTDFTMTSLNIRSYKKYKNILYDLVDFGKIEMVEKSKNQFTSNKIALVKKTKATTKAMPMQVESIDQSNYQSELSIIKQLNLLNIETIKQINKECVLILKKNKPKPNTEVKGKMPPPSYSEFEDYALEKIKELDLENLKDIDLGKLKLKYESWKVAGWETGKGVKIKNWKTTLLNTLPYLKKEKNSAKKENEEEMIGRMKVSDLQKNMQGWNL